MMVFKARWCSHQAIYKAEYPEDEDAQWERAHTLKPKKVM
jgi:hypothetical protein